MVAMKAATDAAERHDQDSDAASTTGPARRRSRWNCSTSSAARTRSPDAVRNDIEIATIRSERSTTCPAATSARSPRSSARRSTPSSPRTSCRRSTTPLEVERTRTRARTIETLWCEVAQHLGGGRVRARGARLDRRPAAAARTSSTPARRSPCRSARRRSAACSTWSASRSTTAARSTPRSAAPIHRAPPEFADLSPKTEIFETGIKVIDLLCPLVRGGKTGLFGGAGVGKTVIIQELIARLARFHSGYSRASPASASAPARATTSGSRCRRPRSATPASRVIDQTVMVFGQMNEPPGARLRVALSALTMAEYFRDQTGADTLLFIDNIFRFTQAGSEVSALLGRMPSAVGYQPTLATEMGELQERITSTKRGAITSIQAIYVPADDYTDPAPANAVHPPRRVREPRALDRREGHLPGGRSARLVAAASSTREIRRRAALRGRPPRAADPAALQGPAGHHRDPRRRRAVRGGQAHRRAAPARSSASSRSRSSSPSSSPASRATTRQREDTIRSLRGALRRQVGPPARAGVHVRRHRSRKRRRRPRRWRRPDRWPAPSTSRS